jgi:tetratricopeptide (TPR) repeat protein
MTRKAATTSTLGCGIALAASILLVTAVAAQSPQDQCAAKDGVPFNLRIAACSTVIESGNAAPRDRASAFVNRGNAYYAKRDYDGAIVDYGEAIGLDPDNAEFHAARGRAYRSKEDHDHAFADFDTAIRLDPNLVIAFGGRGVAT